ncbi:alpha amylase C-terminal domain-containing protein [Planobispora siamensis]|uniref:alpha amylase C-terminal domain-containing protein n=1 Tax=Planobispora siamensis TaxID=936338 RepID=UPI0035E81BB4
MRRGLQRPWNVPFAWQTYNCLENHDLVLDADDHREPRIAALADGSNPRSWYARSRARAAMALLLTAPGVPLVFMGQEFLEDKLWSDNPHRADRLIWWDGLEGEDRHMVDYHRCTRDLIQLRRHHPALRAEPITVYPLDDRARVGAFQRWVPGEGHDVVVVVSFAETTFNDYVLGFPAEGRWREIFNSDFYDHYPNDWVRGNQGGITADGPARHGMPSSARITLPANSALVFAR